MSPSNGSRRPLLSEKEKVDRRLQAALPAKEKGDHRRRGVLPFLLFCARFRRGHTLLAEGSNLAPGAAEFIFDRAQVDLDHIKFALKPSAVWTRLPASHTDSIERVVEVA